jgi:hypothetical protein
MAYKNTKLEAEGAEFLVLGKLLVSGIASYKTYTNMPGYDLVATNPEQNTSARIQVKSRWTRRATGFLISRFDCDFVVFVRLNLDSATQAGKPNDPEYFVFPVSVVEVAHRSGKMPKVILKDVLDYGQYQNNWELVSSFLVHAPNNSIQRTQTRYAGSRR